MVYLKDKINEIRYFWATNLLELHNWVDATYIVHDNMRSHTDGVFLMGIDTFNEKSTKQKLNSKSSTESKVIGMLDYVPYSIWMGYFLAAQGYKIKRNVLYQENQSAILLEKNGRTSCTGNSRHVNIRYFWVKDKWTKRS